MIKKKYYIGLLILPLVLVMVAMMLNSARGPYWLGSNLDPEYVYLLNAANLANLKGVGHIDHPGTPVQVVGALTIRVVHFFNFSSATDWHTDVLQRPEYYLNAINMVMVALNAGMLFLLGVVALGLTRRFWVALWLQVAPFFSVTLLQFGLTRVTPEPFLFFSSTAMVVLLMIFLFCFNRSEFSGGDWGFGSGVCKANSNGRLKFLSSRLFFLLAFAMVCGFGIANKITYLPLVIIPFVVLPKIKEKILFVAGSIVGFIVFTLPIIRMYPRFFGWIINLVTHSGRYGSGPSQLIALQNYVDNIKTLLTGDVMFSLSMALATIVIGITVIIPSWRRIALSSTGFRVLVALTTAQWIGLFMVSKHSSIHYLLPVLNLSGIVLLLILFHLKNGFASAAIGNKQLLIVLPVLVLVIALGLNSFAGLKHTVSQLSILKENSLALYNEIESNYRDYGKIFYYRSSSPAYALKFGNDLSRSYHSERLNRIYKNSLFYDIWTKRFTSFDYNQQVPLGKIRTMYSDKIVFQGSRGVKIPGVQLKDVLGKRFYEGIFIPVFSTNAEQNN